MLFSKRGLLAIGVVMGLAGGVKAEEGQSNWLKTIAQNALPSNAPNDKPATVAGTRGLSEPSETVDTTARDDAAIDRLDKVTVSSEAVNRFIAEGKLR